MRLAYDLPEPDYEGMSEGGVDRLAAAWAEEVRRHQLYRVNFVTGGGNDQLSRIVAAYPDRFTGFAHHPLTPATLPELRRAAEELGLGGYKILAPRTEVPFDDERLGPLWEYIEARRLPVLIHFGWLGNGGGIIDHPRINPLTLARTALAYPGIPFVIAHFGCGYWRELLQLCWACPNVSVDTSGSNQWVRWVPYPLDLESLFRKAYETIGPRRVVFGTDSAWFPRGFSLRYLQDQIRVCRQIGMRQDELQLVFGGNAAELLGLECPSNPAGGGHVAEPRRD